MEQSIISNDKQLMRKVEDRLAKTVSAAQQSRRGGSNKAGVYAERRTASTVFVSRLKYRSGLCVYSVMQAHGAVRTQDVYSGFVGGR
jgi:hypothetical protein